MLASAKSVLLLFCVLGGDEKENQGICLCGSVFCTPGFRVIKTSRKASWLLVSVLSVNWMLGSIEFRWWWKPSR